jgi:hypothetical protein
MSASTSTTIAVLHIDGDAVSADGDLRRISQLTEQLRVLDLERGAPISYADAPARWARFLPGTLRSHYLYASSTEDLGLLPIPEV